MPTAAFGELPSIDRMMLAEAVESHDVRNPHIKGMFAFIDGSMHASKRPGDDQHQRRLYNGCYGVHGCKALCFLQRVVASCGLR